MIKITHKRLLEIEKAIKKLGTLDEYGAYWWYLPDLFLLYGENEAGRFIMVNERIDSNHSKPLFIVQYDENQIISGKDGSEIEEEMRKGIA